MSTSEKDQRLSQLFQLKRAEIPSEAFWRDFDIGLQRKFAAHVAPKPSWIQPVLGFFQPCRWALATVGGVACAFLAISSLSLQQVSEDVRRGVGVVAIKNSLPSSLNLAEHASGATLALTLSSGPGAHYVCDNLYKSELQTAVRPLAF